MQNYQYSKRYHERVALQAKRRRADILSSAIVIGLVLLLGYVTFVLALKG